MEVIIKMVRLNNIKCVLFDFDDTLFVHDIHLDDGLDIDYIADIMVRGSTHWSDTGHSVLMQRFIDDLLEVNSSVHFGLIGGTECGVISNSKIAWIKEHYGIDISNYCSCSQEFKVTIAEAVIKANNFNPAEVLVIDDVWQNLDACEGIGCMTATPLEVAEFIAKRKG